MGPAATVHFYGLVTSRTDAAKDSDHINILITSTAAIPDRTDFILGKSTTDPLPAMLADAHTLEAAGADFIALPCNTAQFFGDRLREGVHIPILDIVRETAEHTARRGFHRAAVLATEGSIRTGLYERALGEFGVGCHIPDAETQSLVNAIIYDHVKAGRPGGDSLFARVAGRMFDDGCDCLILGCTELPLAAPTDDRIIDSLEVLAYRSIVTAGAAPKGFSPEFMKAYEKQI